MSKPLFNFAINVNVSVQSAFKEPTDDQIIRALEAHIERVKLGQDNLNWEVFDVTGPDEEG